jgi:hypothetical protein
MVAILLLIATSAAAQTVEEIQTGIAGAKFVSVYSDAERARAVQRALHLNSPPTLAAPVLLTPDAPYAPDGSYLSFWKPSFVVGTKSGGEAGINFWGKFQQGHMNIGLANIKPVVLDCRMLSAGPIAYKIYDGSTLVKQGEAALREGHLLLRVSAAQRTTSISVELWPTPSTQPVGIFGCELSVIEKDMP